MKKTEEQKLTATEKIANGANNWLAANGKLVGIIAGVVVIAIIALAVVFSQMDKKNQKQFSLIEEVASTYNELFSMDPASDEYATAVEDFKNCANELVEASGLKKYPGAKAALLLADYAYAEDKNYEEALELYNNVAEAQSKTYLAQVAKINAAACYENLGDVDAALEIYNDLWDEFGTDGVYGSRALFNTARIYESKGQTDLAIATYEQLLGEFEDVGSEYAKLAKSRIAQLN